MESNIQTIDTAIIEVKTIPNSIDIHLKSLSITREKQKIKKSPKVKPVQSCPKNSIETEQISQLNKLIQPLSNNDIKLLPIKLNLPPAKYVSLSQAPLKNYQKQTNSPKTPNQILKHEQIKNEKEGVRQNVKKCDFKEKLSQSDQKSQSDKQNLKKDTNFNINEPKSQSSQMKKSSSSMASINNQQIVYDQYWDENSIEQGLKNGILIQGKIRINPRSYEDSFLTDPNGGSDIYISGLKDRNRALNNDVVVVKIKDKFSWKILDLCRNKIVEIINQFESENKVESNLKELLKNSNKNNRNQNEKKDLIDLAPLSFSRRELLDRIPDDWFQRTGVVVGILEKKNNRWAAGHLKLFPDKNKEFALFSPNDSRVPRMKIKLTECPHDFYSNPLIYQNTLFIAQIVDIPSNSRYAIGELKRSIGQDGNIEVETEAVLIENGVDFSEFSDEVIKSLPQMPWSIPSEEYKKRKDLRDLCIFTIDPATARDLDDALHCIQLEDDLYEVGVHIADVSYFVAEDSPIDICASERATSVYLVQKVIPMLPRLLCEQLCSLNPNTDRLTFSVVWKMRSNGEIIEEWFGRTIINSAVKLSYDHAQAFIEIPTKEFDINELPPIRGEFTMEHIKSSVLNLQKIALKLRENRFKNGCLVLNQVKLNYILNKESGLPFGYSIYQQKDSNRLVEEFMLLANIAVAHRIYNTYPFKAILRRHPTPNQKQLTDLAEIIKSNGFDCDVTSSSSIQTFLQTIQQKDSISSLTLTSLLTRTMQLAQYFCSGSNIPKEQFYHYGLAVPLYTHFTSPIRRYPDVLVHRLLASSLGYCQETERDPVLLQSIAENCNDKKYSARVCSERSSEMFFSLFVNECAPLEDIASVTQIKDHSFDVLIINLGISKRIYCDKLNIIESTIKFVTNDMKPELSFTWKSDDKHPEVEQKLELFSTVNVILTKHDSDPLKFNITLKHPNEKLVSNKLSKEIKERKEMLDYQNDDETSDIILQRIDTDPYICD